MQSDAFEFDPRGALLGHRCIEQSFTGSGDGGPLWPSRPTREEMEALFEVAPAMQATR